MAAHRIDSSSSFAGLVRKVRRSLGRRARLGWILVVLTSLSATLVPNATAQSAAQVTVGVGSSSSGSAQLSIHAFSEYPQTGTAYLALGGAMREIELTCVVVQPGGGTTATYASGRDEVGQTWYLAIWDFGPTSTSVAGDPWSYGQSAGSEPCGYSSGSQTHYGEFQTTTDPTLLAGDAYAIARNYGPAPEGAAHVATGSGSSSSGHAQFSIHAFSEYPQTGTVYLALGGAIREIELSCVVVQPGGGGTFATYASGRDDIGQTWYLAVWDWGPTSSAAADPWSYGQSPGAEPCGYSTGSQTHYGEFQTRADPTLLAGDMYESVATGVREVRAESNSIRFSTSELQDLQGIFDLPSTASEAEVSLAIEREESVASEIEAIRSALLPEVYAGLYVTHSSGDTVLHVGVVKPDVVVAQSAVQSSTSNQTTVMYFEAIRTLAQLNAIQNSIRADSMSLEQACGVNLVSFGVNETFNRVDVGTYPSSACVQSRLDQSYGYGSTSNYQEEEPEYVQTPETAYPPMEAGLRIHRHAPGGVIGVCTTSFVLDSDALPPSSAVATAGHCGANGDTWFASPHGSSETQLGSQVFDQQSGKIDGAVVTVPSGSSYSQPKVFVTPDIKRRVIKVQRHVQATKGMHFCEVGSTTGSHCGTITAINRDKTIQGDRYTTMLVGHLESGYIEPGDSGGAVYRPAEGGASAVGTISASIENSPRFFFTHIEFFEEQSPYHVRVAGN